MLKTTVLGLATAASLSLAAAALSPAFANYGGCTENPEAKGCPGALTSAPAPQGSSVQGSPKHMIHAHNYRGSRPTTKG
jgi:hypothetical protein